MRDLLKQVRTATGLSRELDREISVALGNPSDLPKDLTPRYSGSLDAATQAMEERFLEANRTVTNHAFYVDEGALAAANCVWRSPNGALLCSEELAATPALAVIAALLAALEGTF